MSKSFALAVKEIEDVLERKKPITDEIHDKAIELMIARQDIKAIGFEDV